MSTRAKYCRAAGTIVDGRIRDLQEHRDLGYAVSNTVRCRCEWDTVSVDISCQVFARDVGTASPQEILRVSDVSTSTNDTHIKPS